MSSAAEASAIWLDTAAVTRPPSCRVFSVAIFSRVDSRGGSSTAKSPTGTISRSKRPSAMALSARSLLCRPKRSMSSREMSHFFAIMSAELNCETSPSP